MEGESRGPFGWRLLAVGSLFLLALGLGLMSFVFLPPLPPAAFGGVTRIALATAEGVREHAAIVAAAFLVLGAATGLGFADRLVKPIALAAGAVLLFFVVAAGWTLHTIPARGLLDPLR